MKKNKNKEEEEEEERKKFQVGFELMTSGPVFTARDPTYTTTAKLR